MGMGYQGFVAWYTSAGGTKVILLCTGSSVNQVLEPIVADSAVYGLGWYNAPEAAHYGDGALRYEGTAEFDLQATANVWNFLGNWAINERAYPKSIDISPDGQHVYSYHTSGAYLAAFNNYGAWASSLSMSTAPASFVGCSVGVLAIYRTDTDPVGGTSFSSYKYIDQKQGVNGTCTIISATNPLNPSGYSVNPIVFWKTNAQLLRGTYTSPFSGGAAPQANLEAVDWSIDLNNNATPVYTMNGTRLPTAVMMGVASVTGNVTLFSQDGIFDPILGPTGTEGTVTNPYLRAENTWFRVAIDSTGLGNYVYLELPAVLVESDDYSIRAPSEPTTRAFGLKGFGGRCNSTVVMPPLIMSDINGAFVSP